MGKTIYQLLNDVETDFSEYENAELTSGEKDHFKTKILMEVKNMKAEEKKRNRKNWKKAVGVAAAFSVVAGAAGIAANPVFAKQIFNNVFGTLIDSSDDGYIGEKELYTKIGGRAKSVREEVDKYNNSGDYVTTVENNGVALSVSDVYCDGGVLHYTFVVRTNNEELNKAKDILLYRQDNREVNKPIIEKNDGSKVPVQGMSCGWLRKSEDGSFVGMESVDLYDYNGSYSEKLKSGEDRNIVVNYKVNAVTGITSEYTNEEGKHDETVCVDGEWNLKFPVTVEDSSETIEINKEENGIMIKNIIRSKTFLIVKVDYSGHATKPPFNYEGCPVVNIKDSEGNYLECMGGGGGGSELFTVQDRFLYDGQKDLVIEVGDYISETESTVHIADIPVTLP